MTAEETNPEREEDLPPAPSVGGKKWGHSLGQVLWIETKEGPFDYIMMASGGTVNLY